MITSSTTLDPACTYTGGITITASGVELDCQGATIREAPLTTATVGILVSAPATIALHDIVIRNCRTEGFRNGMRITRTGFRDLVPGDEYRDAHHNILVEESSVTGSKGVGIFVDAFVTRVTLRRLSVTNAGSSGIYLEAGSRDNIVIENEITSNGARENGPDGQHIDLANGMGVWFWGVGREGISIDGSRANYVARNYLRANTAGGIFLYKNCGEFVHQRPDRWWERRYGADDNLIEDNQILDEPTGIWVGSRMGENTLPMDCSDPAYVDEPPVRVTLDHAAGNIVRSNQFSNVGYGIRVEDDQTRIVSNYFEGPDPAQLALVIGTNWRTSRLGQPVQRTTVEGNAARIHGNSSPYRWVHGHDATTFVNNTAHDDAAELCQAPSLPANPFIFVRAFVPHDAEDPPPPAPAALPSLQLPPLAPCPAATEATPNPLVAVPSFTG